MMLSSSSLRIVFLGVFLVLISASGYAQSDSDSTPEHPTNTSEPGKVDIQDTLKDLEAMIDALVDSRVDGSRWTSPIGLDKNDPYQLLRDKGFEAVPALIKHLDDPRLTRAMRASGFNTSSWPLRIRDQVGDLIQGLAGNTIRADWRNRQPGENIDRSAVQNWWKRAAAIGEEKFLVKNVYPERSEGFPNSVHLGILKERYPEQLPAIYRKMLKDFPKAQSYPAAKAVYLADLPDGVKIKLFKEAVAQEVWDARYPAMNALWKLDNKFFLETLRDWLADWPNDALGEYHFSRESRIASLVLATTDEESWTLFQKVLKKAKVGLRMELLGAFDCSVMLNDANNFPIKTLLMFLDDETLRVAKGKKYSGPYAGFYAEKIRVCDFVAGQIASMIKFNPVGRSGLVWKRADRRKLKEKVEEILNRDSSNKEDSLRLCLRHDVSEKIAQIIVINAD